MIVNEKERLDFTHVPQSKGITRATYYVMVVGLIGIFAMGFLSVFFGSFGHVWPADHTQRVDLGKMPTSIQ